MGNGRYAEGLDVRRAVLGDEYVDRALGSADGFSKPVQEFMTEYCWGGIWTRPALPRKTRSLITLAMLTVLAAPREIQAHVRGALRNGATPEEIREVLLQAMVYSGVPRGLESVRAAQSVLAEEGMLPSERDGVDDVATTRHEGGR